MKVIQEKLYKNRDDVTLTSYLIDDSPEMLNGRPRGGVLICPGGGYLSCSDREAEPIALRFASMGYHAFVLRYSVFQMGSREEASFLAPGNPLTAFPQPVVDLANAVLHIKRHAEEWLIREDQIALSGYSAGAHNCAMYATGWNQSWLLDAVKASTGELAESLSPDEVTPDALKIGACVLGYTVTDMNPFAEGVKKNPKDFVAAFLGMMVRAYAGTDTIEEVSDEMLDLWNVTAHVGISTPPMFLWTTAADNLIPSEQTVRLAASLAHAKIPYEMHVFEEGEHGSSLATRATAGAPSQILDEVSCWPEFARRFLDRRFDTGLAEAAEVSNLITVVAE